MAGDLPTNGLNPSPPHLLGLRCFSLGWFKTPVSSQTHKLMAGTKFSDYLGLKHYKKAKNIKHKTFHSFKVGPAASKF
jgi:hypothetical protein